LTEAQEVKKKLELALAEVEESRQRASYRSSDGFFGKLWSNHKAKHYQEVASWLKLRLVEVDTMLANLRGRASEPAAPLDELQEDRERARVKAQIATEESRLAEQEYVKREWQKKADRIAGPTPDEKKEQLSPEERLKRQTEQEIRRITAVMQSKAEKAEALSKLREEKIAAAKRIQMDAATNAQLVRLMENWFDEEILKIWR
jgi:hypothetical protein